MDKSTKTLVNKDFVRAVKTLRKILPKLSFGLLIGTYLISAITMGMFHFENATTAAFQVAAFAVPLAIQAGRGTLVFFFQLNPARIQSRFSMAIVAATGLLGLSIWESFLILKPHGLAWLVSVCTLMLIGYIIEIMILRETMFFTQMELYQNKEQWQELKDFYTDREQFEQFMDALDDGRVPEANYVPADALQVDFSGMNQNGQRKPVNQNNGSIQNRAPIGFKLSGGSVATDDNKEVLQLALKGAKSYYSAYKNKPDTENNKRKRKQYKAEVERLQRMINQL